MTAVALPYNNQTTVHNNQTTVKNNQTTSIKNDNHLGSKKENVYTDKCSTNDTYENTKTLEYDEYESDYVDDYTDENTDDESDTDYNEY